MKQIQKTVALGLVQLMLVNSSLGIWSAQASFNGSGNNLGNNSRDNSSLLLNDVKTLRASIDSGKLKPAEAMDAFSASIVNQNLSLDDVTGFMRTQMTEQQFEAFQRRLNSSLNGIDPASLSPNELGEVVGQSIVDIQSTGLYWDGCVNLWVGASLIAGAIVAGIFAIIKSKSASAIQADYAKKIAAEQASAAQNVTNTQNSYAAQITNTTNTYNKKISDTDNWQTALPQNIKNANGTISSDQNNISSLQTKVTQTKSDEDYYQNLLNQAQANLTSASQQDQATYQSQVFTYSIDVSSDETNIKNYQSQISSDNSDISSQESSISGWQKQITTYTANPAQAPIDAQNFATSRDAAIADLQTQLPVAIQNIQNQEAQTVTGLQGQETADVAAVPANQSLAKKLAIGGGIGAAVGTGLLVYGLHQHACN